MTADFDLVVRGGLLVDGFGLPRRRVDVGVRDGRVAALGHLERCAAADELDADGMIVAPGIVDAHTHYDPQITFDPYATVSCFHGVTTVVAGNCGFSVAPCKPADRPFLSGIFARVENMDPVALSAITWDEFETFPEFLASRAGRLGVNLACYVGHSNLRRWVMGDDASTRAATRGEVDAMRALVREAMAGGAAGLSSSAAPTHFDLDDRPVPSRVAARDELLALVEEAGEVGGGSIAFLPASAIGGLDAADEDYLVRLSRASGLPVVIQGLGGRNKVDAPTATWEAAQAFLDRATAAGAPVYSMLIARPFDRPVVLDETNFHYLAVPAWDRMLKLPHAERLRLLQDAAARAELRDAVEHYNRDPAKGTTVPPPLWSAVFVDVIAKPEHAADQGRSIAELAASRGVAPADAMLDLALDEDLATRFRWRTESPEWAAAVGEAQRDARMIVGTSDGGAHLARDDGADWSSYFLRSWVLDRAVWTLEEGIRQITQVPAAMLGLTDRGVIRVGGWADLMVFDPKTIGPSRKEFVHDLPGGVGRFKAWGRGVAATVVNGVPIVRDGELTGALPGQVVRPGRAVSATDTSTRAGAGTTAWVFDADGHVVEPPDLWARHLPARFADYAPHAVQDETGFWFVCHDRTGFRIAGRAESVAAPGQTPHRVDAPVAARGGSEPGPRLADMAVDRIGGVALYPTYGLMIQGVTEREPALALCRAVNDWTAEYCAHDPARLLGVATLPLTDVGDALAEARRCVEQLGFRGVWRRPEHLDGLPRLQDAAYEPLWSYLEEADVAFAIHPGMSGLVPYDELRRRFDDYFTPLHAAHFVMEHLLALTTFVAYGILERHPGLRVAFLESGAAWALPYLHRLDEHAELFGFDRGGLRLRPSEYFARQCFVSVEDAEPGLAGVVARYPDSVVFASDYPHADGTFPGSTTSLLGTDALDDAARCRVLADNARRLYGLGR